MPRGVILTVFYSGLQIAPSTERIDALTLFAFYAILKVTLNNAKTKEIL